MQEHTTERGFEAFFRKEYAGVVCVVARIVDERVAEDVVQEAFSKLYDRLPDDPLHARNLLYRTALNGALSARRSALRRSARERRFQAPAIDDPMELVERRETRDLVRRVLARLSHSHASVLALRYSGYSYREVAEILRVSVNNVGVMLYRAEIAFEKEYERASSR
jgi:RNA polymerase sigma factor (sigma-70 family)